MTMNILLAGGTGFIGSELVDSFHAEHQITVLGRDHHHIQRVFGKRVQACTWQRLSSLEAGHYDVVINLCGHNIAASRWTESAKKLIIESRVKTNAMLIQWLIDHQCKPHYYSANAVGIYGVQDKDTSHAFDEDSPIDFDHPRDFLSEVGIRWQKSLQPAIDYGMPVTITRFGVVLKSGQGMLKKLAPSFNLSLGSIIGDGEQIISWVHIADVIRAFHFLLEHPDLIGAFNITSPNPVPQKEFARLLAKAMHRPLFLKTPAFVIRLLFGEMGECLINRGQRVVPKRLPEEGFKFAYPDLEEALAREF
ncbi:TIGR01777 family oxidoreductase [Legionella nagasakiensis]|uniref:TIGR01777 family oxidoreductase n=1 Tax=Legionella nagasakiensis TaxID=535290 RepID=UPI001F5ED5C0|nr:TIGR01777 family oxidoreductase [Legionella nagasakiensis]